ncbi:MAG: 4Fe-4S binding protein [Candidatus Hydrogenedentota bacterium]
MKWLKKKFSIASIRRIIQIVCFLLFLYLVIESSSPFKDTIIPDNIFIRLSPYLAITGVFLEISILKFIPAIIILFLTFILGRFFCGWVCPLGTLLDITDKVLSRGIISLTDKEKVRSKSKGDSNILRYIKYILFFISLILSIAGICVAGLLDPLCITFRFFSLSLFPYLHWVLAKVQGLGFIDYLNTFSASKQPLYNTHIIISLVFVTIIATELIKNRFWCRYLCPTSAILAMVSRFSFIKRYVTSPCNQCGICGNICRMGTLGNKGEIIHQSECIECMRCKEECSQNAIKWGIIKQQTDISIDRRVFLSSIISSLVLIPLFKLSTKRNYIRPPGALSEKEFLKKCVRCGMCMRVCPTNGLQPVMGLETLWTPELIPRIGPCEYYCNDCGKICPGGAIQKLTIKQKTKFVIGRAEINKKTCLVWSKWIPCLVCEEFCPVPEKAIKIIDIESGIGKPVVEINLCVGCGKCENVCPVEGSAIKVNPVAKTNILLNS